MLKQSPASPSASPRLKGKNPWGPAPAPARWQHSPRAEPAFPARLPMATPLLTTVLSFLFPHFSPLFVLLVLKLGKRSCRAERPERCW